MIILVGQAKVCLEATGVWLKLGSQDLIAASLLDMIGPMVGDEEDGAGSIDQGSAGADGREGARTRDKTGGRARGKPDLAIGVKLQVLAAFHEKVLAGEFKLDGITGKGVSNVRLRFPFLPETYQYVWLSTLQDWSSARDYLTVGPHGIG
jgi:hypothetical protein